MIESLSDKILENLNTLKGTWKPFVDVYNYHTLENNWYPYVAFELVDFLAEIGDNCSNMRTFIFDIYIFQEIASDNDRQEAKDIIYKAMDDVIELFDEDFTLGGLATGGVEPIGGTIVPFITQSGKALVATIKLNCKVLQSIK